MVPFNISEESVRQMKLIMERTPEKRPEHGIRIYISGLCGAGPEWNLTLDTFSPDCDECCEFDGLRVMIERDILESVGGISVEYESFDDDEDCGGFLITCLDPQVQALYDTGGCGACCGGKCHGCHGGCHGCHDGCCHDVYDDDE